MGSECNRIRRLEDVPPPSERIVDVAILDMNHEWPNLGHDCIVHIVHDIAESVRPQLELCGLRVRALSFDIRKSRMIPERPGSRFSLYLGTGGPGHLDPHHNDAVSPASQGILEDPSWEAPAFRLFDSILRDPHAALLAVCHSFGVLCRWAGVAEPVLRGPEKRGKRAGVYENYLTREAVDHPWFSRLSSVLPDGKRLTILDNRLFDLIPTVASWPDGMTAIGYEFERDHGIPGDALTMLELARDACGRIPRIFGVNHHPEILDPRELRIILERKYSNRDVSRKWYEERSRTLDQVSSSAEVERSLRLTAYFTLIGLLRFHLFRQLRLRAASLGRAVSLHEDEVLGEAAPSLT